MSFPRDTLPAEFLETFNNKLKVIAAFIVPCSANILVLSLRASNWHSENLLRDIIVNYHIFVAPVVQVLSTILASLQLYVIFTTFEFSSRTHLTRSDATLNTIRFWASVSSKSLNLNLPLKNVLLLLTIVAISTIPASLWAASITPQLSSTSKNLKTLAIPLLGQDGFTHNVNGNYLTHCLTLSNSQYGTFSGCPATQFYSNIVSSARAASAPKQNISRFDTTQNIYIGRSYGIAAAVGLTDSGLSENDKAGRSYATAYNYTEIGFQTEISCSYIKNSPWQIHLLQNGTDDEGIPYIYQAADTGQNGLGFYSTWSLHDDSDIVAWTTNGVVNYTQPLGIIYIAAGQKYSLLSNISCWVDFRPKEFGVTVDKVEKNIRVSPGRDFIGALDPDFHLRNIAMEQLGIVSQVSTTLYFSAIGDALLASMTNSKSPNSKTSNLATVADSFANMLDAILLALTSTQTQLPGFETNSSLSQQVPVYLEVTVARIGNLTFIIAISVLNFMVALILLLSMIRSRFWKDLPRFSYLDVGSVIVASGVDGRGIRRELCRATESNIVQDPWAGAKGDKLTGDIVVGVRRREIQNGQFMLTLDSGLVTTEAHELACDSHELLVR